MATKRRMERISNRNYDSDIRINSLIRSKLVYLINELNSLLEDRHSSVFPELTSRVIFKTIRDIRMYRRLATKINPLLIDEAEALTYKR